MKNNAFYKILSVLFVLSLFVAACAVPPPPGYSGTAAPAAGIPPTAPAAPAADVVPVAPAAGQPVDKCDWLRQNFPQSTEAIQAYGASLAGVVPERVRTHVFRCTPETTVFDGFVIVGPNEGYSGTFTLAVPVGGAVDSYAAATYSGRHEVLGAATDTVRAFDGTVTAVTATYWPWLDENPPVSGGTAVSQHAASTTCVDPTALAAQQGWTYAGSPDNYGGLVVTLASSATLPQDWESVGPEGSVKESDVNREMSAGTHTIYPPYSCRAALGYSQ